jgi:hypothetical protein
LCDRFYCIEPATILKRGETEKPNEQDLNKINMKTDFYTKAVLTVIALCLMVIVFKDADILPRAYAGTTPNLKSNSNYAIVPLNANGSIDVNLKSSSSTIEVDLVKISTGDELEVNIEEVAGSRFWGGIPVVVKKD